jgi:hypothetical protein
MEGAEPNNKDAITKKNEKKPIAGGVNTVTIKKTILQSASFFVI